jgi:hypothetical protein
MPSPFELSSDPWAEGGSLFTLCDLHLNDDEYVINQEDSISVSLLAENEGIRGGNTGLGCRIQIKNPIAKAGVSSVAGLNTTLKYPVGTSMSRLLAFMRSGAAPRLGLRM